MATPNDKKRKRLTITLAEKQSIIDAAITKPKTSDLATHLSRF
jgi:hypothetical protein